MEKTSIATAIKISFTDNVAIALNPIEGGEIIQVVERDGNISELKVLAPIPFAHKVAVRPIKRGEDAVKYGESIGVAQEDIPAGQHVHVQNLVSKRAVRKE